MGQMLLMFCIYPPKSKLNLFFIVFLICFLRITIGMIEGTLLNSIKGAI